MTQRMIPCIVSGIRGRGAYQLYARFEDTILTVA